MLISELIENVVQFPNKPITIKIGRHQVPTIQRGDIAGWNSVEYLSENKFDKFIHKLLPIYQEFDEDQDVERVIAHVDDDIDMTAIVLLKDGRIGYQNTIGESMISSQPIPAQTFLQLLQSQMIKPIKTPIVNPQKVKSSHLHVVK